MYKLPKNIRQIGQVGGNRKIYVEDYVITFTKQLVKQEYGNYSFAVLLGSYAKIDGSRNIFINGAVEIKDMVYGENINFTNDIWTSIYDSIKKYFTDIEVVGWYIGGAGLTLEIDDKVLKTHKDNFVGQDKVLFMYDSIDQEEAFFLNEGNNLKKQEGYYIYYERNEEMQNYMIDRQGGKSTEEDYEDKATKEIRQVIEGKKEEVESKRAVKLLYGVSTVFVVVVLVIAATMFQNYDKLTDLQNSVKRISNNAGKDSEDGKKDDVTTVEKVEGNLSSEDQNAEDTDIDSNSEATDVLSNNAKSDVAKEDDSSEVKKDENSSDSQNDTKKEDSNKVTNDSKDKNAATSNNEKSKDANTAKDTQKQTKKKDSQASKENKTIPESKDGSAEKSSQYYIVQKGDTLVTISLKFYHTVNYVNKIMKTNNIEDQDHIIIGQKLMLP
ncbi:LysM peptidoglycan-binding domain-containing protein [Anaeromicropila herbilytica]|uniref:LysM domain-containing protein n=1 Tax=Anaeromicropila herbilytica TaxID=2785025 RepID=A0A7R7EHC6_9FIRM|nr:LysM peptidoglycan-binding domain-containing protein [Anaeromicropila herbilytica]BCN28856.1 hypothetical protein bsdtb5_01510 [Anaeromicropila herbilytica]